MPYDVKITMTALRMAKKLPKTIRKKVADEAIKLGQTPHKAKPLKGKFRHLRSLHITIRGVQYRVAYQVIPGTNEVVVEGLGSRENFYKMLERSLAQGGSKR